jgi:hypothetical protein
MGRMRDMHFAQAHRAAILYVCTLLGSDARGLGLVPERREFGRKITVFRAGDAAGSTRP